jgi:hypothetical protein
MVFIQYYVVRKHQIITLLVLVNIMGFAQAAKSILFYEVGAGGYSIQREYSIFAGELSKTHKVASIERDVLTRDKLESYDILVMQNLQKQLTTEEISAIIWFVLQNGKGLFINGAGGGQANQLTIPFGVTIDRGMLIDVSDQIPGLNDRSSFTVDRFYNHPGMGSMIQGVSKIGLYRDSGLVLSGNSKCIASGNSDTYSDTGSFSAGSLPCVAAASQFGGGQVVVLSDADMLGNKYVNDYNNKRLGVNIIEWLSLATDEVDAGDSADELLLQVRELRLNNMRQEQQISQLEAERQTLISQYGDLSMKYASLEEEHTALSEGMIGPFSRTNWAIIILGVCFVAASVLYSQKRSLAAADASLKDEDILDELGYEIESDSKSNASQDDILDEDLKI